MRILIYLFLPLFLLTASAGVLAEKPSKNKNFIIQLPVNVNQADANMLSLVMTGVGPKKAEAIVQYREVNGPFHSTDELANVKGIGPGTLERNRGRISVD